MANSKGHDSEQIVRLMLLRLGDYDPPQMLVDWLKESPALFVGHLITLAKKLDTGARTESRASTLLDDLDLNALRPKP